MQELGGKLLQVVRNSAQICPPLNEQPRVGILASFNQSGFRLMLLNNFAGFVCKLYLIVSMFLAQFRKAHLQNFWKKTKRQTSLNIVFNNATWNHGQTTSSGCRSLKTNHCMQPSIVASSGIKNPNSQC